MSDYGVIFDVDGVLVDSGPPHRESWHRLAREVHLPMSDEFFARTFGQTNKDVLVALFGRELSEPEWRPLGERKEELYREIVRGNVPPMPGAVELVEALGTDGARLAVGSSGPAENIELCLGEMDIRHCFRTVITGEHVSRGKPDPQVFLLAAEGLALGPERCIVVEDAVAGVEAAKRAGMAAVALTSGQGREAFLHADLVVDSLRELSPARLVALIGASANTAIESFAALDPAVLRDVAVVEIIAWGRKPDPAEVEARRQRLQRELDELDPETKGLFVAKQRGVVVGVGRVMQNGDDSSVWMVYGLAVHPGHRRQGIGRALLDARVAFARSRGAKVIVSETHADNQVSITYHEAVGFVSEGRFIAPDGDEKIAFSMAVAE